ncbi:hypothetical protein AKJ16_DCAP01604 [Drosera capensis]
MIWLFCTLVQLDNCSLFVGFLKIFKQDVQDNDRVLYREVMIYAALYLKLKTASDACYGDQEEKAAIIAGILNSGRWGKAERNEFVNFLAKSKGNLEELVFVKPLHVRIQLNTRNHPKADNGKDFILTDTDVDVNDYGSVPVTKVHFFKILREVLPFILRGVIRASKSKY